MIQHNLVFGGFYIHYKHNPEGEPGNYWYQVLNLSHLKDQDMTVVTYRPLYKSHVYKEGRHWDGKLLSDWMLPLPETVKVKERYRLVVPGTAEHDQCIKLVQELYGEDEQAFYGLNMQ
ncbi:MAG: hypothetical protein WCG20_00565 [bacterium]